VDASGDGQLKERISTTRGVVRALAHKARSFVYATLPQANDR